MPPHYYQSGGLLDPTLAQQPRREPGSGLIGPIDRNPILGFISDRASDVARLLSLAGRHPASRGVIGAPRLDVDEVGNRFGLDDLSGLQGVAGLAMPNEKLVAVLKVWAKDGIEGVREMVKKGLAPAAVLAVFGASRSGLLTNQEFDGA